MRSLKNDLAERYVSTKLGLVHDLANIEREYRKTVPFVRANYVKHFPPCDAHILDVGCGLGHFLYSFRELGYGKVQGLDSSPECVDFCNAHGLAAFQADALDYFRTSAERFDVIVMNDIIEHLPKGAVIETLKDVRRCLNPGGVLFIKTFNAENPLLGLDGRYADFTHETGFTALSMRQVLLIAGFEDVKVRGSHLYVYYANPLNYIAWGLNSLVSLFLSAYWIINGRKSARIFTKNIIGAATR